MREATQTPGACCSEPLEGNGCCCPVSKGVGRPVSWITMVALSRAPIPLRQEVFLCPDPDCEVVYFGSEDLELRRTDVHTVPGFKEATGGLVCYCFQRTQLAVEKEARTLRASPTDLAPFLWTVLLRGQGRLMKRILKVSRAEETEVGMAPLPIVEDFDVLADSRCYLTLCRPGVAVD